MITPLKTRNNSTDSLTVAARQRVIAAFRAASVSDRCIWFFSVFITFGGPQAHDHSLEDAKQRHRLPHGRGSATRDCRIPSRERKRPVHLVFQRLHHLWWAAGP